MSHHFSLYQLEKKIYHQIDHGCMTRTETDSTDNCVYPRRHI